jgi:glycosyltransferase involved in cell wall biosynthesis
MNEQPLVSVAMPVYNAEKYLRYSIESILNQTYANFELIMVNDASTDSSGEIILSYSDPRIRYFENAENLGIVKTRNKCIEQARGKYIAVLDNDDIALPMRLEKQVEFLEANSGYGLCGSYYEIINEKGTVLHKITVPAADEQIKTHLLFNNCFCNSSVMIQSRLLKGFSYPEGLDMVEDFYFLHYVSKKFKIANLPVYVTQYRMHGKNTSIEKREGLRLLRKTVDSLILTDLGIPFSGEELDLHSHFVNGNFHFFKNTAQLVQLEAWLVKIYRFLKAKHRYDMRIVERIFIRRWFMLFRYTSKISYRIFFNKLIWNFKLLYLKYFIELVTDKYSKQTGIS